MDFEKKTFWFLNLALHIVGNHHDAANQLKSEFQTPIYVLEQVSSEYVVSEKDTIRC